MGHTCAGRTLSCTGLHIQGRDACCGRSDRLHTACLRMGAHAPCASHVIHTCSGEALAGLGQLGGACCAAHACQGWGIAVPKASQWACSGFQQHVCKVEA
eukprot:39699-Chlamydomonas_euryale.AAC.5